MFQSKCEPTKTSFPMQLSKQQMFITNEPKAPNVSDKMSVNERMNSTRSFHWSMRVILKRNNNSKWTSCLLFQNIDLFWGDGGGTEPLANIKHPWWNWLVNSLNQRMSKTESGRRELIGHAGIDRRTITVAISAAECVDVQTLHQRWT